MKINIDIFVFFFQLKIKIYFKMDHFRVNLFKNIIKPKVRGGKTDIICWICLVCPFFWGG